MDIKISPAKDGILLKKVFIALCFVLPMFAVLYIGHQALTPRLPAADVEAILYSNQTRNDLTLTYLRALKEAKHSVLLIVYALRDEEIIRILRSCAARGIEITMVGDHKASKGVAQRLGPEIRTVYCHHKGLMHQKILVIDDEQVWIGSANMTRESLRYHGNLILGLCDGRVAQKINHHATLMIADGMGAIEEEETFTIAGQEMSLAFLPDNGASLERLLHLLSSARKSIKVAMFTWTHPSLIEAVVAAKRRGVMVEVVLDHNSSQGVSNKALRAMQQSGAITTTNDTGALLHHKFVVIDDNTLVMGSANWTKAAFTRNNDCIIIIPTMTKDQNNKMARLWRVITAESS